MQESGHACEANYLSPQHAIATYVLKFHELVLTLCHTPVWL